MIDLSADRARELLHYNPETGDLIWKSRANKAAWNAKNAYRTAGCVDRSTGYRKVSVDGRIYLAHRIAWLIVHGRHPLGIDHQDGQRSNNKLANLREAQASENSKNAARRSDNRSGITGVRFHAGAWRAEIKVDGTTHYLGRFADKEMARLSRESAMQKWRFHPNHGREAAQGDQQKEQVK